MIVIKTDSETQVYAPNQDAGSYLAIIHTDEFYQRSFKVNAGKQTIYSKEKTLFVSHDTSESGRDALRLEMIKWEQAN